MESENGKVQRMRNPDTPWFDQSDFKGATIGAALLLRIQESAFQWIENLSTRLANLARVDG
jgi:hypothetical protein